MARPTKFSEATAEKIASGIRIGLTDKDAALVAGISEPTLFRWRRRFESFENLIARARNAPPASSPRFRNAGVATGACG